MSENDNPGVIAPPPLILLCSILLGFFLNRLYPLAIVDRPLNVILSAIFFAYAILTAGLAFYYMKKSGTNINTRQSARAIVTTSVFSYSRNPIYLAMVILMVGFALFLNALWVAFVIPVFIIVMQKGVIEREEAYLERKFGDEYLRYKTRVRRWI